MPDVLRRDEVRRIKGPIAELLSASPVERAEFLANALAQEVKAPLQKGVGRFEALLQAVGLGGKVDRTVRDVLFELLSVRNVLVHRNGRVDARFLENCPWLGHRLGDNLRITAAMSERYRPATIYYLIEILIRWLKRDSSMTDISSLETVRENALKKVRTPG